MNEEQPTLMGRQQEVEGCEVETSRIRHVTSAEVPRRCPVQGSPCQLDYQRTTLLYFMISDGYDVEIPEFPTYADIRSLLHNPVLTAISSDPVIPQGKRRGSCSRIG
jgi:hypothetical protein